jgi:uroporphyrinogen decarboxylase
MERITDSICQIARSALGEAGNLVDCVRFADDLGIRVQHFMSPDLYKRKVKPHHARYVETLRRHSAAKVIMHCDGAIFALIPDLIDLSVDVLDHLQVGAVGMNPERLKREFGADLCFWGAVDVQGGLPFGSP